MRTVYYVAVNQIVAGNMGKGKEVFSQAFNRRGHAETAFAAHTTGKGGDWVAVLLEIVDGIQKVIKIVYGSDRVSAFARGRFPWSARQIADVQSLVAETSEPERWEPEPTAPEVSPKWAWEEEYKRVKREVEEEARSARSQQLRDTDSPDGVPHEPIAYPMYVTRSAIPAADLRSVLLQSRRTMGWMSDIPRQQGTGVKIAVLDTGCNRTHPLLSMRPMPVIDATGTGGGEIDEDGHGTFVCSQIVGITGDGVIVGECPDATIIPIQVMDSRKGYGADSWIARGIDTAVRLGVQVISMSLGGDSPMPAVQSALERADKAGIVVVVAAGNGGGGRGDVSYPARYATCVAVGATDSAGNVSDYSQRGPSLDVWACGTGQPGAGKGSAVEFWSGTSMATPRVAAMIGVYQSCYRMLHDGYEGVSGVRFDVESVLAPTTPPFTVDGRVVGIIQADKSIGQIKVPTPPPGPVDPPSAILIDVKEGESNYRDAAWRFLEWLFNSDPKSPGISFRKV